MAPKRQIRLCTEGLLYTIVFAAVVGGAVSRQLNLLMLLGSMLAGPMLFSLIYGRLSISRLRVERRLPPTLRAGEPLVVEVQATNLGKFLVQWTLSVTDRIERESITSEGRERVNVTVHFPRIAPGETQQATYRGSLPRRGRYQLGPLRASTRFPLGLVRHSLVVDRPQTLVVLPRLGQLTREWHSTARQDSVGNLRAGRRGHEQSDFYGLRDWRPGDSRRSIHWRTSARRGAIVVRQFDTRRNEDSAVVLDLWQPAQPTAEDIEHVERAVSMVATLVADACKRPGRTLRVHLVGSQAFASLGTASPAFFREQMETLAEISPHSQAEAPAALTEALATLPPTTPIVLVSTREIDRLAISKAAGNRAAEVLVHEWRSVNVSHSSSSRLFEI